MKHGCEAKSARTAPNPANTRPSTATVSIPVIIMFIIKSLNTIRYKWQIISLSMSTDIRQTLENAASTSLGSAGMVVHTCNPTQEYEAVEWHVIGKFGQHSQDCLKNLIFTWTISIVK